MTTETMEDEIRVLARIEVAAATAEITHIARQLEDLRKQRIAINRREAALLADRLDARRRLNKAKVALGEDPSE